MEIDRTQLHDEAYCRDVFKTLLRDYQHIIVQYCVTRLGASEGEDIAQEVFLAAWESLRKFRQESSVETWLLGSRPNIWRLSRHGRPNSRSVLPGCVMMIGCYSTYGM
jgi:DNA-directed RNA polymerase specialized sigma24 family protein